MNSRPEWRHNDVVSEMEAGEKAMVSRRGPRTAEVVVSMVRCGACGLVCADGLSDGVSSSETHVARGR